MRRLCLPLLLAACPGPAPARPVAVEEPPDAAVPLVEPDATVLFLDSAGRAVPLACAQPGVGLYVQPSDCFELIEDKRIADLGGGRRKLGDPGTWTCAGNGERHKALRVEAAPGRKFAVGDPANELLVWPTTRAAAVTIWERPADPTDVGDDIATRYGEIAERMATGMVWYEASDARLLGTLRADIDGDGVVDEVYSVGTELAGDGIPRGPRMLLGALSTHPEGLLTLRQDDLEDLQAFAALDLDGDRAAELVIAAPYYDGDATVVARFDRQGEALVTLAGVSCGN